MPPEGKIKPKSSKPKPRKVHNVDEGEAVKQEFKDSVHSLVGLKTTFAGSKPIVSPSPIKPNRVENTFSKKDDENYRTLTLKIRNELLGCLGSSKTIELVRAVTSNDTLRIKEVTAEETTFEVSGLYEHCNNVFAELESIRKYESFSDENQSSHLEWSNFSSFRLERTTERTTPFSPCTKNLERNISPCPNMSEKNNSSPYTNMSEKNNSSPYTNMSEKNNSSPNTNMSQKNNSSPYTNRLERNNFINAQNNNFNYNHLANFISDDSIYKPENVDTFSQHSSYNAEPVLSKIPSVVTIPVNPLIFADRHYYEESLISNSSEATEISSKIKSVITVPQHSRLYKPSRHSQSSIGESTDDSSLSESASLKNEPHDFNNESDTQSFNRPPMMRSYSTPNKSTPEKPVGIKLGSYPSVANADADSISTSISDLSITKKDIDCAKVPCNSIKHRIFIDNLNEDSDVDEDFDSHSIKDDNLDENIPSVCDCNQNDSGYSLNWCSKCKKNEVGRQFIEDLNDNTSLFSCVWVNDNITETISSSFNEESNKQCVDENIPAELSKIADSISDSISDSSPLSSNINISVAENFTSCSNKIFFNSSEYEDGHEIGDIDIENLQNICTDPILKSNGETLECDCTEDSSGFSMNWCYVCKKDESGRQFIQDFSKDKKNFICVWEHSIETESDASSYSLLSSFNYISALDNPPSQTSIINDIEHEKSVNQSVLDSNMVKSINIFGDTEKWMLPLQNRTDNTIPGLPRGVSLLDKMMKYKTPQIVVSSLNSDVLIEDTSSMLSPTILDLSAAFSNLTVEECLKHEENNNIIKQKSIPAQIPNELNGKVIITREPISFGMSEKKICEIERTMIESGLRSGKIRRWLFNVRKVSPESQADFMKAKACVKPEIQYTTEQLVKYSKSPLSLKMPVGWFLNCQTFPDCCLTQYWNYADED